MHSPGYRRYAAWLALAVLLIAFATITYHFSGIPVNNPGKASIQDEQTHSICKECIWEQPIVGMGATSGEMYSPRKIRDFKASVLHEVEVLNDSTPGPSVSSPSCARWLVTATINPPTPNLQALARLPGWCKVFVLDKKSPPDFALNGPGVVVLTAADQEALPWRMARLLPWNHFGRKNLGYAYAVLHGAEIIYDTEDDGAIEMSPSGELLLPTSMSGRGNLYMAPATTDGAYNPYPFWDAHNAWPRGFPLSLINTITAKTGATRAPNTSVEHRTCMLQSLVNTELDTDATDAIYRLTQPLPLSFPIVGAQLMYPAGVYAPANAQATLLSKDVAAALLMPVTVHGRVSDIWRSYILQRVMWDSGCRLTFTDPWVKQFRNAHGYLKDFQAELDLYLKAEGILQVLNELDFGDVTALGPRVYMTFKQLYEYGIIQELDVKLAYAYLRDLSLLDSVSKFGSGVPTGPGATAVLPVPAPASSGNRVVVCLTGMFRAGPFTLNLIKKNVLETLDMPFDTVVSTPAAKEGDENVTDFLYLLPNLRAVVHPVYSNYSWIAKLDWSRTYLQPDLWQSPIKLVGQLADLLGCKDAIRKTGVNYTHAMRIRSDTLIMDPVPIPLSKVQPRQVVVPNSEEYRGVNDRYVYGRIEDMNVLFDELHAVPSILPRVPYKENHAERWTAEIIYLTYAADNNITFDKGPVRMCRARDFKGGVLVVDEYDLGVFPVCKDYCGRFLKHS